MSTTTPEQNQREALEAAWKLLNIQADTLLKMSQAATAPLNAQADTLLKLSQAKTEPWKLAIGGVGAGAALFAGAMAFTKLFL